MTAMILWMVVGYCWTASPDVEHMSERTLFATKSEAVQYVDEKYDAVANCRYEIYEGDMKPVSKDQEENGKP